MLIDNIILEVERILKIDVLNDKRSSNLIDARMIVYKIAHDAGYNQSEIARALNRNPGSINNYDKKFDDYRRGYVFNSKYLLCLIEIENIVDPLIKEKKRLDLAIKRSEKRIKIILDYFKK